MILYKICLYMFFPLQLCPIYRKNNKNNNLKIIRRLISFLFNLKNEKKKLPIYNFLKVFFMKNLRISI